MLEIIPTFLGEKCKIVTFGHKIFPEMVSHKLQLTCYLDNAVNWKNNLFFFSFLGTIDF